MKKIKSIIIIFFLSFFSLEFLLKFFYPQDLQGTFFQQIENGLAVNKKFYKHKLHRYKNYTTSYEFGEFHNRITAKKTQKENILVLGDSWTLGYLLKDEDTFVHKLQKKFPNYYFINAGTGGMGTSSYTRFCEIFCETIKPKYVVVFLNTGDIGRGWKSLLYKVENNNLVKGNIKIYIKPKSKMDKIPFYSFLKHNSHLFIILRNTVYDILNPPIIPAEEKMNYASKDGCYYPQHTTNKKIHEKVILKSELLFKNLQENAIRANSKLIVINTGWYNHELMDDKNPNKLFLKNAPLFFKKNNILYLDNTPHLKHLHANLCKYIIPIDSHPNTKGAEEIYKASYLNLKTILK